MAKSPKLVRFCTEALEVTRQISAESFRAWTLGELAEQLTPELLLEALEIISQISDESYRADALNSLAKQLPPELLQSAFSLVELFRDKYHSASAWQGFLSRLEDMHVDMACFAEGLDILAYQGRKSFIGSLPALKDTLTRLGGKNTLALCLEAVREVCAQWP